MQIGPVSQYWRDGTALIEACLAKAVRGDPSDVPMPLVGDEAKLWHQAQAEAYRHALEMMGVPQCAASETPVIDLHAEFWKQIMEAAAQSSWIPKEYSVNDWISDVCTFLREGGAA